MQVQIEDDVVDLGVGQPQLTELPLELLKNAFTSSLLSISDSASPSKRGFMQYGAGQGSYKFRSSLSELINRELSNIPPCLPESICITNGSSHALGLVCKYFTRPGDVVLVEEPTYFLALKIFEEYGLKIEGIPIDSSGLQIDKVEDRLASSLRKPSFLYTIPTYHNPTGITLSPGRRANLVSLSHRYNVPIVADEVYQFLYFEDENKPPPPMWCFDDESPRSEGGGVLSVNSFSKILAPGMRLGWVQTRSIKSSLLNKFKEDAVIRSAGGYAPFISHFVSWTCSSGNLEKYMQHTRQVLKRNADALAQGLRDSFPTNLLSFYKPEGGYFIWAKSHKDTPLPSRNEQTAARVRFIEGAKFCSHQPKKFENHMRFSFSHYPPNDLRVATCRLAGLL